VTGTGDGPPCGRSGPRRTLLCSISKKISHKVRVPLIMVRQPLTGRRPSGRLLSDELTRFSCYTKFVL
jgi:hypothetical protein